MNSVFKSDKFRKVKRMKNLRKYFLVSILTGSIFFLAGFGVGSADLFFQITKNMEIFGKLYREVMVNYVDEIDPSALMKHGIDAMLDRLDPYTIYMDDSSNEVELLMTGSYGGVGITVLEKESEIIISDVIEGYSAQKEGLRLGDTIVKVDTVAIKSINEMGKLVKGKPGTRIKMFVKRAGFPEPLEFNLTREKIELKNVPVATVLPNNIGYIQLARFNKNAAEEVKQALLKFKPETLNGLILDLRGNPGGRLDEAVDISKKFLPRNSMIVFTKGRSESSNQQYRSDESPIYPTGKMIVLIDSMSASASEIVAGALQDHDRATLVGIKSYGKGLVQTIAPVGYNNSLKITTARYYTPSGRCIQIRDINDKTLRNSKTIIDSIKVFKTDSGRELKEANGIMPDYIVSNSTLPEIVNELELRGLFFDFSSNYAISNPSLNEKFVLTDKIFDDFLKFVEKEKFTSKMSAYQVIDGLKSKLEKDTEFASLIKKLESSKADFHSAVISDLKSHKQVISIKLRKEILSRKLSDQDVFLNTYQEDVYMKNALDYLTAQAKK